MGEAPLGAKVIAAFYGVGGTLALFLGAVIVFLGFSIPLSSVAAQAAVVPEGTFGIAVFGAVGAVPIIFGLLLLLLARGLWDARAWALWTTIGLNAIELLLFLGLAFLGAALAGIPVVGNYVAGQLLQGVGTAAINAIVIAYLWLRRDEFRK